MTLFSLLQTLSLWLHVISLALWIGGIAFFLFVFGPAVHALSPGTGVHLLNQGRRSLQTLSWVAISLILITGFFNLISRGVGSGFEFGAGYYAILAIKFFLFLAMIFHHSLQAFKYAPEIVSITASTERGIQSWPEPLLALWKRWFLLLKINATLGPIVVLLGLGLSRS